MIQSGPTMAASTTTAVTSFRSLASSPMRIAIATSSRKSTAPITAPITASGIDRTVPTSVCPRITLARPSTITPMPICASANACICAKSAPEIATRAFESASPNTVIRSVLVPSARSMRALSPVARIAAPSSVLRKRTSTIATTAAISAHATSIPTSAAGTSRPSSMISSPSSRSAPRSNGVKTVEALIGRLLAPITRRFTE